jgi:hypothetical protein
MERELKKSDSTDKIYSKSEENCRGGISIKRIVLIMAGIIISILLVFGYHHFLKFQTYSVNESLEVKGKYSFHINEIALYPYQQKEEYKKSPWYYKVNWLSMQWRNNIAKIDRFFSFPYDKSSSEIVLKGVLSGDYTKFDDNIMITVNSKELKAIGFTMVASVGDKPGKFAVALTFDEKIKSLQALELRKEDATIKWDNLDETEENHYFLSPFYNQRQHLLK